MSLQKFLPAVALSAIALGTFSTAKAQMVYVTKNAGEATVKVYTTTYKDEADVIVFKTPFVKNAQGNKGQWHFTKFSGEADKRIFYTGYKTGADVIVYFTADPKEAGWKNKKKRYLMN